MKMGFVYGTKNEAKLQAMRQILLPLPIEVIGINSVLQTIPQVDESGSNPLENAVLKAAAYYNILKMPVFSCDSGLFIEGLTAAQQPGVHVRTVNGKHLTDDEMLIHYSSIAKQQGGTCRARYKNAICLIYDDCHTFQHMGDDISGEPFLISNIPHPNRREGFPLDSLSVHIASGKYYFDLKEEVASGTSGGFQNFFLGVLRNLKRI